MTGARGPDLPIEYEPRLVEEAVLRAVRGRPEASALSAGRDRLYEIADPEAREAAFRSFHAGWFERLGLGAEIPRALRERPSIAARAARCVVACAPSSPAEGAELFVPPGGGREERTVALRLRPETLALPERLRWLLRHELTHIDDMLDPRFGYEPRLPTSAAGPAREGVLVERYRVLWDAFIDGRLARLGRAPAGIRVERFAEFARAFPMLGEGAEEAFERFFAGEGLTHAELLAFAADPERTLGRARGGPSPGERCPLCGFPTHVFEPEPESLPPDTAARIRREFPEWDPGAGLCQQCAELYRSRSVHPAASGPGPAG